MYQSKHHKDTGFFSDLIVNIRDILPKHPVKLFQFLSALPLIRLNNTGNFIIIWNST